MGSSNHSKNFNEIYTKRTVLKTILVIDDNDINRKILAKILSADYNVWQAENGKAALDILEKHRGEIHGIMLDLIMPVMNGYDFLKTITEIPEYRNIPIIVSTENSDELNEMRALEAGAWDFISKPYKPRIIQFRLRNAIERSQLSAFHQLKYLAEFDTLTGIYNKTKFFQETHKMLIQYPQKTFMFIRFDINRFHLINSFFGETKGDDLLRFLAQELREFSRTQILCMYGRIEADIFAMCIPYTEAKKAIEIITEIQKSFKTFPIEYNIVPTFGLYIIEDRHMPVHMIFDRANLAAKKCKGNYINSFAFYDEKMGETLEQEQKIINEMNTALLKKQFIIYLQPKYNLQTNSPSGAEALVRWKHPQRGMILPGDFISIFERNGFISKLDFYVWEKVCRLLRKWLNEGKFPHPISVNVSRVNLYNPKIIDIICRLTDKYKIPPELFNLELTESAYTDNPAQIKDMMKRLQKKGFIIMMDDFGSGYSSLNILKDISVDVLKIDMKFLSKTDIPGRGENIIASVVRMAKWLNIPTIAEGVEKAEQVSFLRGIGCEYIQGYYFAKPMPVEDYEQYAYSLTAIKKDRAVQFNTDNLWISDTQVEFLFSNVLQSMAIYEFENDHVEILRVNDTFFDVFGYENFAYQSGKTPLFSVDERYQAIVINTFNSAVSTKDTAECDYLRNGMNGEKMWVHIKVKYINRVGQKYILFGSLVNITPQKKMEHEVQKYRAVISHQAIKNNKILVVDALKNNRLILRAIFERDNMILEAENGKKAIEMLQDNIDTDIILLDLWMPIMDGIQFLDYINQIPMLSNIPVILMIEESDITERKINIRSLKINDYITKPFMEEKVMDHVNKVLESHRRFGKTMKDYHYVVELSRADPLTGIYNWAFAEELIADRLLMYPLNRQALILLDMDNFKELNYIYGHELGDKILINISEILKGFFQENAIIARLEGDKMCVFMTGNLEIDDVCQKSEDLCREVHSLQLKEGKSPISCSIGIAMTSEYSDNLERLLEKANTALYQSKKEGKNQYTFFCENSSFHFLN